MAVTNLIDLKKKAIKAGMSKADARTSDRDALEDFISSARKNGKGKKKVAKKVVKKAVAKVAKKKAAKATPKKRPTPAAKSAKTGKAKRSAKNGNAKVGRATIGKVDYSIESDAWKPRKGSPVELIWKSLKRHRDNTDKVFAELRPNIKDFVHAKGNDGTKRDKAKMEATLKYRINRTRFEYAVRTGQHSVGEARVKYGTGPYAKVTKKAARAEARKSNTKKASTKKSTKKSGRKASKKR